jgi:inner membrane protein involved in colicin E2 resistance
MDPMQEPGRSEFRNGFALAWGVAIASLVLAFMVAMVLGNVPGSGSESLAFFAGVLPPLALLGLLAGCWFTDRRRMAHGVLAAFGTMFAVVLLGVAACFGLVGFGGF